MSNFNDKKTIKNNVDDSILTAKNLAKEKYEEDPLTKISTRIGYFEKRLFVFNRIFFWTILFYPLMLVLNDIYENKFVHNNKFWIKKGICYGIFLVIVYFLLLIASQVKIDYLPVNIFLIFGLLYITKLLQNKFGYLLFIKDKEEKLSEDEIKNIIDIQQIDLNENNQNIKIKSRIIFLVLLVIANMVIFKFESHYIATFVSLVLIVIYDNFEQRYLKRDKTNLFWKKRIVFYVSVVFPILIVSTFVIYDTLIFKY